jgi:hypothetical protein
MMKYHHGIIMISLWYHHGIIKYQMHYGSKKK